MSAFVLEFIKENPCLTTVSVLQVVGTAVLIVGLAVVLGKLGGAPDMEGQKKWLLVTIGLLGGSAMFHLLDTFLITETRAEAYRFTCGKLIYHDYTSYDYCDPTRNVTGKDLENVGMGFSGLLLGLRQQYFKFALTSLLTTSYLLWNSKTMGFLYAAMTVGLLVIPVLVVSYKKSYKECFFAAEKEVFLSAVDVLRRMPVVRSFGAHDVEQVHLAHITDNYVTTGRLMTRVFIETDIIAIIFVGAMLYILYHVIFAATNLTTSLKLTIVLLWVTNLKQYTNMMESVQMIAKHYWRFRNGSRDSCAQYSDVPDAVTLPTDWLLTVPIQWTRLDFSYIRDHDGTTVALVYPANRLSAGERVHIVGPNGAGKTTFLNLLAGKVVPDTGEVRVGGVVYSSELATVNWVGFYTQNTQSSQRTILEQLRYGNSTLTREETEVQLKCWGFWEFFTGLENGLDTRCGTLEHAALSGGQAQLVAVLQVLLTGRPILLLDEPTSNLSTQWARQLAVAMNMLPAWQTVMFVSHDVEFASAVRTSELTLD